MSNRTPIDVLKEYRVSSATIAKLKKAGISSIEDLYVYNPHELVDYCGLSEETAVKISRIAREVVRESGCGSFIGSALEYADLLEHRDTFTTGVRAVDQLLGGGIRVGESYEFVGEFGAGKTQICHQLAVTVQLPPEEGGLGAKAVYIDTEGTFTPSRIMKIAERFELNPREALKNIVVVKAVKVDDLHHIVFFDLRSILEKENIKLAILDSVIALHRAEFVGRGKLAERQQSLNSMLDMLRRFMMVYDIAVVLTNQVLANPAAFFGPTVKAAGGHVVAHFATHRFFIRKSKGDLRVLECFDSPRIPSVPVSFRIKEDGLHDVE